MQRRAYAHDDDPQGGQVKDPRTGKDKTSKPTYTGAPGEPTPIRLKRKYRAK